MASYQSLRSPRITKPIPVLAFAVQLLRRLYTASSRAAWEVSRKVTRVKTSERDKRFLIVVHSTLLDYDTRKLFGGRWYNSGGSQLSNANA